MVSTYHPNNPVILPQLRETRKMFEIDNALREIFKYSKSITSQREP